MSSSCQIGLKVEAQYYHWNEKRIIIVATSARCRQLTQSHEVVPHNLFRPRNTHYVAGLWIDGFSRYSIVAVQLHHFENELCWGPAWYTPTWWKQVLSWASSIFFEVAK